MKTYEEILVSVLSEAGPVIALGRPGEELPEIGAKRVYTTNDTWQDAIVSHMESAKLIVLRIGITGGLAWEVEHATGLKRPNKLVLLIPDSQTYKVFRGCCGRVFPRGLPQWLPDVDGKLLLDDPDHHFCTWPESKCDIQAIMRFDDAWNPTVIPVRAEVDLAFSLRSAERKALSLVVKAVGIDSLRPKFLARVLRMIKLTAAVALVAVLGVALMLCTFSIFEMVGLMKIE